MLVLGQSGRNLDETRRQDALSQLRQSLEAFDSSRFARGRVHRAVLKAPLDAKQVNPRLWQRKPDLDVLTGRLCRPSTAAIVAGHHHLDNVTHSRSPCDARYTINPFNASSPKLLLFEGSSAILV